MRTAHLLLAISLLAPACIGELEDPPGIDEDESLSVPQYAADVGGRAEVVDTGGLGLRLRSGPGTGYAILLVMPEGSVVDVTDGPRSGWYKVRYQGTAGWCYGAYLRPVASGGQKQVTGTGGDGLNLRSGPGTGYRVLLVMPEGAVVEVRAGPEAGWYKVAHQGTVGWCWGEYLGPVSSPAPTPAPSGDRLTISGIVGHASHSISQWYGPTSFDGGYSYCQYYGDWGGQLVHCGIDIAIPYGTPLYVPASGEVIVAGGSGYYRDDYNPAAGELRIQLDDGTHVILGHTSRIDLWNGQSVSPGQRAGASGTAGTGAHLHLEVRVPDSSYTYGYRTVDPAQFFGL